MRTAKKDQKHNGIMEEVNFYSYLYPNEKNKLKSVDENIINVKNGFFVCYNQKDRVFKDKKTGKVRNVMYFTHFNTPMSFFQYFQKLEPRYQSFFECVRDGKRKMAFDIDCSVKLLTSCKDPERAIYRILTLIITKTFEFVKIMTNVNFGDDFDYLIKDFVFITSSSNKDKYSFHINFPRFISTYNHCSKLRKYVVKEIKAELINDSENGISLVEHLDKIIDKAIYSSQNQQLRTLYSTKAGANRYKLPLEIFKKTTKDTMVEILTEYNKKDKLVNFYDSLIGVYDDINTSGTYELSKYFIEEDEKRGKIEKVKRETSNIIDKNLTNYTEQIIQYVDKRYPDVYQYDKQVNDYYGFTRLKPHQCDICNREHDSAGCFVKIIGEDEKVMLFCWRQSGKPILLAVLKPIEQPNNILYEEYKKDSSLSTKQKKLFYVEKEYVRIQNEIKKGLHNYFTIKDGWIENPKNKGKYLDPLNVYNEGVTIIKAPLGAGKSTVIKQNINAHLPKSALFLTNRIALAESLIGDLTENTFIGNQWKCYNSKELPYDLSSEPYLINQMESLIRLKNLETKGITYEYLVIDEVESLLKQISSETVDNNLALIFHVLCYLVRTTKRIICADGHITNRSLQFLFSIRTDIERIINPYREAGHKFIIYEDAKKYLQVKLDSLKQGKNIYEFFSHKSTLENFEENHLKFNDDIDGDYDILRSPLSSEQKIQLQNVNEYWKKRYIGMSPVITTGVNFDPEIPHFDAHFAFLTPLSCTVRDCIQGLTRDRKNKSKITHVFLSTNSASTTTDIHYEKNPHKLEKIINDRIKRYFEKCEKYNIEQTFDLNSYENLQLEGLLRLNELEDNRTRGGLFREFLLYAHHEGYSVEFNHDVIEKKKKKKDEEEEEDE